MLNNYTTLRGDNMPQYGVANGENSLPKKWYVRPAGLRGLWGIRKLWPFLSGNVLTLDLIIQSDSQTSIECDLGWWLYQYLPDMNEKKLVAEKHIEWSRFDPPIEKNTLTVYDVLLSPESQYTDMIGKWGKSVREIWKREHETVRKLVEVHT
jgi:hypothetical protein